MLSFLSLMVPQVPDERRLVRVRTRLGGVAPYHPSEIQNETYTESVERAGRYMADLMARGLRVHGAYYTLGEYDAAFIIETPPAMDEKFLVEKLIEISDAVQTQTMVAVGQKGVSLFPEQ
jgi:uncharacterized protein with GYD domain